MTIAWAYLDKKAATVSALKDYHSMEFIIGAYEKNVESANDRLFSCGSPVFSVGKTSGGSFDGQEMRVCEAIDELDILKARYKRALEYMDWFKPAWDELGEDEQIILTEFYQTWNKSRNSVISNISKRLFIERSTIYSRKDKAVEKLMLLLYGK